MIAQARKNLDDAVQSDLDVYNEKYTFLLIIVLYGVLYFWLRGKKIPG